VTIVRGRPATRAKARNEIRLLNDLRPKVAWDFDGVNEFVTFDMDGKRLGGKADRNGYFYVNDAATGKLLDNRKSPSPKTGELDNRGSQFYLAMYWAQELAAQKEDAELAAHFAKLAKTLTDNEAQIVAEFTTVQGKPVDIGGYYKADADKCKAVMRPSPTFNAALKAARG
jgi:monomeric type NADP-dependent isocitrate dehydrogenase